MQQLRHDEKRLGILHIGTLSLAFENWRMAFVSANEEQDSADAARKKENRVEGCNTEMAIKEGGEQKKPSNLKVFSCKLDAN